MDSAEVDQLGTENLINCPLFKLRIVPAAGLQRGAEAGLAALYGAVVQPHRSLRNAVLQALVRRFDAAASLHSKEAAEADIR